MLGFTEVLMVIAVLLLIFGPKKLPALGRSIGEGLKEFKNALSELHSDR